jgi:hypothetical protein
MKFNNIHTALTDADLITTLETANVFRFGISSRDGRPSRRPAAPTRSMLRNTTKRYRTRRSRLDGSLTRTGGRRVGRPHSHRHSGRHRINKTPRPTHTTGKKPPSCSHTDTAARRCSTCCRPALPHSTSSPPPPAPAGRGSKQARTHHHARPLQLPCCGDGARATRRLAGDGTRLTVPDGSAAAVVASTSSLASAGFCVGEMIFAQLIFIKKKTAQRMHARNFISNQVVRDDSNSTVNRRSTHPFTV